MTKKHEQRNTAVEQIVSQLDLSVKSFSAKMVS